MNAGFTPFLQSAFVAMTSTSWLVFYESITSLS